MKTTLPAFLLLFLPLVLPAQVTLVRSAAPDTFDLGCSSCSLGVTDVAVLAGQQWVPYDFRRGKVTNLLHWRYYDSFLREYALYPHEMLTEKSTQLLDSVEDTALVSIHIILTWTDSIGRQNDLFLLVAGVNKQLLFETPFQTVCDSDPYTPQRFAAVARIKPEKGTPETYDALEGELTISTFDPKKGVIAGQFAFDANCVGWQKTGYFHRGEFSNKEMR